MYLNKPGQLQPSVWKYPPSPWLTPQQPG